MNRKERDAFLKTAKRMVDGSKGRMTMDTARKELAKILNSKDQRSK